MNITKSYALKRLNDCYQINGQSYAWTRSHIGLVTSLKVLNVENPNALIAYWKSENMIKDTPENDDHYELVKATEVELREANNGTFQKRAA